MGSRIKAVIRFNQREAIRAKIGQYMLLILMLMFVFEEGKALMTPNTIIIENAHASMVTAAEEVSKAGESSLREERGEEVATQTPQAGDIEQMILDEFGDKAENMLKIARCESQLNPKALGDQKIAYVLNGKQYGTSHGIFQIRHLPGRPEPKELEDPSFNIQYAKKVLKEQGYGAWYWCANHNGII